MKARLIKRKYDVIACIVLFLIIAAFFSRLFYPNTSFFIVPEYNGSDTTNFNIPIKMILSQSYKAGEIPLWNKNLGTGFPLLAETQIGYFFLPNIILYSLFSFSVAYNLGYVASFMFAAFGMYAYMRYKKFSESISVFAAFTFSFSGFYLGHMNHYNMLQSASLFPWLILLFDRFKEKLTVPRLLIFSLVLSQQIFAGHVQTTFITLCTIAVLSVFDYILPINRTLKRTPIRWYPLSTHNFDVNLPYCCNL